MSRRPVLPESWHAGFDMCVPAARSKPANVPTSRSGGPVQSRTPTSVLVLATFAALVACTDNNNPLTTAQANTTVRFFNAASTLALDIAQNGTVVSGNGDIPFGSASTCMRVNDANPQLSIRAAGTT